SAYRLRRRPQAVPSFVHGRKRRCPRATLSRHRDCTATPRIRRRSSLRRRRFSTPPSFGTPTRNRSSSCSTRPRRRPAILPIRAAASLLLARSPRPTEGLAPAKPDRLAIEIDERLVLAALLGVLPMEANHGAQRLHVKTFCLSLCVNFADVVADRLLFLFELL